MRACYFFLVVKKKLFHAQCINLHPFTLINKHIFYSRFSVNQISSLADFEECPNLQELYLRKNNIQDINDLVYLQVSIFTTRCHS